METPASEAAPTMTENTIQEAEAPIIEEDPLLFQEEEKVFSPQNSPTVIAPTVESNATYSPSKVTENSKKEHQLIVNELTLDDDAQGNGIEKMEEVSDKQSIQKEYESTRNVASE